MTNEFECIECGCQFVVEMVHSETEDEVKFCVCCGSQLDDDLDESFFEEEDDE